MHVCARMVQDIDIIIKEYIIVTYQMCFFSVLTFTHRYMYTYTHRCSSCLQSSFWRAS